MGKRFPSQGLLRVDSLAFQLAEDRAIEDVEKAIGYSTADTPGQRHEVEGGAINMDEKGTIEQYLSAFEDDTLRNIAKANLLANNESSRGRVLIAAATLDTLLRDLVRVRLNDSKATTKLFDDRGPLDSFSANILLARSLDLITEGEYNDLEVVRQIRNFFAHEVDVSFTTNNIRDRAKRLLTALENFNTKSLDEHSRFAMVSSALMLRLRERRNYIRGL